jgi:hypothetical protein
MAAPVGMALVREEYTDLYNRLPLREELQPVSSTTRAGVDEPLHTRCGQMIICAALVLIGRSSEPSLARSLVSVRVAPSGCRPVVG